MGLGERSPAAVQDNDWGQNAPHRRGLPEFTPISNYLQNLILCCIESRSRIQFKTTKIYIYSQNRE